MSQETLINGLAVLGALTLAYWAFRLLAAIAAWAQSTPEVAAPASHHSAAAKPAASAPAPAPAGDDLTADDLTAHDIVVIAAAVNAMLDHHRIVHIEDPNSGHAWSAEGRWMHQTSHRTH